MSDEKERPYGISIFSFLPFTLIPFFGFRLIARWLRSAGMGVQIIPLWWMEKSLLGFKGSIEAFDQILSVEGPWKTGSLFEVLKRHFGREPQSPTIIDLCLFGTESGCLARIQNVRGLHPQSLPIDIPWPFLNAIELGPEMNHGQARQWGAIVPQSLVLDSGHLQELEEAGVDTVDLVCRYGGPEAIRMVHVKILDYKELKSFLDPEAEDYSLPIARLRGWLKVAPPGTPVVLEIHPKAMLQAWLEIPIGKGGMTALLQQLRAQAEML